MAKKAYLGNAVTNADDPLDITSPLTPDQVKNNAGGYVWNIKDMAQLQRFLILGSEGGTFYVGEKELTRENATCVSRCMAANPYGTVQMIMDVSASGRAARNDPALFALAICCSDPDVEKRAAAFDALPKVARTLSHLYTFIAYLRSMSKTQSRQFRTAINTWFHELTVKEMVYQLVKYQSREGYSARDLLRLSHPPFTGERDMAIAWAVGNLTIPDTEPEATDPLRLIWAFEQAKHLQNDADGKKLLLHLIEDYDLTREMIPTWFLKDPDVWEMLLTKMPITAMMRNLVNMSEVGLLVPLSDASRLVASRLTDPLRIQKGRVHPLQSLSAIKAYSTKAPIKDARILEALEVALENGFGWIPKTGKSFFLGLDVSGSMLSGNLAGIKGITPAEATAIMAMVTARTEDNYFIGGFSDSFVELNITASDSFRTVCGLMARMSFGGTNIATPFIFAKQHNINADVFVTYTDNEGWKGPHPDGALTIYRNSRNQPDVRSIVCAMTATSYSVANPNDPLQLDVVGFDTNTPAAIGWFAMGDI